MNYRKSLKMIMRIFGVLFLLALSLQAQSQIQSDTLPPADVRVLLSDEAIAAANANIVKCFAHVAEGEVVITSIDDNVILIKDEKQLLIDEQILAENFIKAIDVPKGPYVLIITSGDKKVTREVVKS